MIFNLADTFRHFFEPIEVSFEVVRAFPGVWTELSICFFLFFFVSLAPIRPIFVFILVTVGLFVLSILFELISRVVGILTTVVIEIAPLVHIVLFTFAVVNHYRLSIFVLAWVNEIVGLVCVLILVNINVPVGPPS